MILTGAEICRMRQEGKLEIEPFELDHVNPNSYDVRLGPQLLRYSAPVLDTREQNSYKIYNIDDEGLVLRAGTFYLGHVLEVVGSDYVIPLLHARLSVARLGLFVHVTANVIDIGNHANFSFHLVATRDIRVHAGLRIAQVSFWRPVGEIRLYAGKYKSARGLAPSQSYRHFERK